MPRRRPGSQPQNNFSAQSVVKQQLRPLRALAGRTRSRVDHSWKFAGRHTYDNRATDAESVVLVLAGHKPQLWPWTLRRIAEHVPMAHDVCLVSPGVLVPELREFAANHNWSYLATENGHISLAQNLAIRAHSAARSIYKLDEDIFISAGYFDGLAAGCRRVSEQSDFSVGVCSPLINVNGYSYVDFLDAFGLRQQWQQDFGAIRRAPWGIPVHADGQAAVWLWRRSFPVDQVAAHIAAQPFSYSLVPHRFSIGAILFERSLWESMGGFKRRRGSPGLGEDEGHLATYTTEYGKVIAVVHNVYAGHFAFGLQMEAMLAAFGDSLDSL